MHKYDIWVALTNHKMIVVHRDERNDAFQVSPSESLDGFLSSITTGFELSDDKHALELYWFEDGQPIFVRDIGSLEEKVVYHVRITGDPMPSPLHPSRPEMQRLWRIFV